MAVQISHSIYSEVPETAAVWSSKKLRWAADWARGFFVDTVGRDTETIRKYIAEQEMEDRRLDQLEMPEITRE
jgi:REP element-mobilizing transposase RayT